MTKVLFLLEKFPPLFGGIETFFDYLTKALVDKGYDVTIHTTLPKGAKPYEIDYGRKIVREPASNRYTYVLQTQTPLRLARETDIIHTSSYAPTGLTWLVNNRAKKKVIATIHELWGKLFLEFQGILSGFPNMILEDLMCRLYRNETLTTPSFYTKQCLVDRGMPTENITAIHHGIEHKLFNQNVKPLYDFDFPTYLFFGRPGISKGLKYLLDAVPFISKEIPDSKLVMMVPRLPEFRLIENKVNKLKEEGKLLLFDPIPVKERYKVPQVIKSVDTVCIPSISEGLCLNAIEAQACGIPVVASKAGALPESVKGGIFVEPRNPQSIANGVIKMLEDKRLRRNLIPKGLKWAEQFNYENTIEGYLKVYDRVVQSL